MLEQIVWTLIGLVAVGVLVFLVSKNIKKALQVVSWWGLYEAYNFTFDFVIWPIIQAFFGFLGVFLLIIVALANNLIILLWYQKSKTDWFGVNVFEDLKTKGHLWVHEVTSHKSTFKRISLFIPAKILQFMIWMLNKNDIFAFVTLSVWQDSFITTIFLRHGRFDKLNKRDYLIFVSSTILSCLAWSVLMQLIIMAVKTVWSLI